MKKMLPPWSWHLVAFLTGTSLLVFALIIVFGGWNENAIRQLIQWSGRISLTVFCVAFSASSVHTTFKTSWSWWILMNRKFLGISFALIHTIHLIWVICLQLFFHPVFAQAATSSLLGGGLAYAFIWAMLITSFDRPKLYLSKKAWRMLHLCGGSWVWIIFMSTYLKRADTEPVHWIGVGMLLLVLLLRVGVRLKKFSSSRRKPG